MQALEILKNYFRTGEKPSQAEFWDVLESYHHKEDKIGTGSLDIPRGKGFSSNDYTSADKNTLNTTSSSLGTLQRTVAAMTGSSSTGTVYNLSFKRSELSWEGDWIKIPHTESLNYNRKVVDISLYAGLGYGHTTLTPIISYPSATSNSGTPYWGFYIKDTENILTEYSDFDTVEIHYNIQTLSDSSYRYNALMPIRGENAINNHFTGAEWHSEKNQTIFTYVLQEYSSSITSYQTYLDPLTNYNQVNTSYLPAYATTRSANIMYEPYVNSAQENSFGSNPDILIVGSHFDNNGQISGSDGKNRHDITPSPVDFLENAIAVSARRDTPTEYTGSTSYGYGMEFFEDLSSEALDPYYPNKDIPSAVAQVTTPDGYILTSQKNPGFSTYLSVGDTVTCYNAVHEDTVVQEILGPSSIRVSPAITPINTSNIYIFGYVKLSTFCGAQQESWAVPLVAGKLKYIKLKTGMNWKIVRQACRATATRNNVTDGSTWDMYRGFGVINVADAIAYIDANFKSEAYIEKIADELESLEKINPLLSFDTLKDNSPISKKILEETISRLSYNSETGKITIT